MKQFCIYARLDTHNSHTTHAKHRVATGGHTIWFTRILIRTTNWINYVNRFVYAPFRIQNIEFPIINFIFPNWDRPCIKRLFGMEQLKMILVVAWKTLVFYNWREKWQVQYEPKNIAYMSLSILASYFFCDLIVSTADTFFLLPIKSSIIVKLNSLE